MKKKPAKITLKPTQIDFPLIDSLRPDPTNARERTPENMAAIKSSLQRFGQVTPVVTKSDGTIMKGNGTWLVAKEMGWKTIARIFIGAGNEDQANEYALSDNQSALLSVWNMDRLKHQLDAIRARGTDPATLGFSSKELDAMLKKIRAGLKQEEEPSVKVPKKASSKVGEIFKLGHHRLMCGDSTSEADFKKLMNNQKVTCVFTDPPYGVSIGKKNVMLNSFQKAGMNLADMASDDMKPEELKKVLLKAFITARKFMADDCAVFVCSPQGGGLGMIMMMMIEANLEVRHILNWIKNSPTFSMGRLDYDYQHEPILFTWTKTHKRKKVGQFQTSLWTANKPMANKEHPTMKPVELPVNAILNHTDEGDNVLDPFGGSGTTLIAAEQLKRKAFLMEISPAYCDVIIKRWENLTKRKAEKI